MAVGLWDSSFKNAFHTLSYRFAAVILVILYSRGKGKELKDAEQGCIADTLTDRGVSEGSSGRFEGHFLACRCSLQHHRITHFLLISPDFRGVEEKVRIFLA